MSWKDIYYVVKDGLLINQFLDFDSAKQICEKVKGEVWNEGKPIYVSNQ